MPLVRAAARAASMRASRRWPLPWRVPAERRLLADSLEAGATPAQAASCPAVGHRDITTPNSAIILFALSSLNLGIVLSSLAAVSKETKHTTNHAVRFFNLSS